MQIRDRVRTEGVLKRLGWHLSWSTVSARQQREIVKELRGSLEEAATAGRLDEALARLGRPRELAEAYLEALRPRPSWAAGILAAGASLAMMIVATIGLAMAFGAGIDAADGGAGTYELWPEGPFGGRPLVIEERAEDGATVGATLAFITPLHLAVMVSTFVAVSRPWLLRHQPAEGDVV